MGSILNIHTPGARSEVPFSCPFRKNNTNLLKMKTNEPQKAHATARKEKLKNHDKHAVKSANAHKRVFCTINNRTRVRLIIVMHEDY